MSKDLDRWGLQPGQVIELNYERYVVKQDEFGDVCLQEASKKAGRKK